ncbi:MAG: DEAD/DEAH box helicase family protein [Cyclobacteriaceae bacterium]
MAQGYKGFKQIDREATRRLKKLKDGSMKTEVASQLSGGAWFGEHPDKVLGKAYSTTNQFNREVIKIKGSLDDALSKIEAPPMDIPVKAGSDTVKVNSSANMETPLSQKERSNLEQVIQATTETQKQEAFQEKIGEKPVKVENGEFINFDEILSSYNKDLTNEEIKAWIWYQRVSGGFQDEQFILNPKNGWSKYVIPLSHQDKHLVKWVEKGIMCFQSGQHVPSVLYYAENIYERQSQLLKDKPNVLKKYGEAQYQKQWERLELIKPKPLTLADPVAENRLILNPKSRFAEENEIKEFADGTEINLNLTDAFKKWLRSLPQNAFKLSSSYNVIYNYLEDRQVGRGFDKDERERIKRKSKKEGTEMFADFLAEAISREDQLRLEQIWNSTYNAYVDINYFKVPTAFTVSRTFKNKPLFIREAQREGIGFIQAHGAGCIAFDVGVGKTMTAILSLAQMLESGQCKRPLIVVPNQTYPNWLAELRGVLKDGEVALTGILPQYPVNDLYNLGSDYLSLIQKNNGDTDKVAEHSITVMTYQGFNHLGFNDQTWNSIEDELYEILNQGTESERDNEKLREKIEEIMGRGIKGGMLNIEDLGFDCIVYDEVHNMKKSFTRVKGTIEGNGKRARTQYQIDSGEPSMIALRAFMISQYILKNNRMRNVIGLSATPFTNSPLEIYSMLALFAFQDLKRKGVKNIKDFFDTFIRSSVELTINAKLKPERKEVILGFNNLISLQQLIFRYINYKTGEDANVSRPNKIVLPLRAEKVDGQILPLPADKQISTNLAMTADQREFQNQVELYVREQINLMDLCVTDAGYEEHDADAKEIEIAQIAPDEEDNARTLRAISFASQISLSPYLFVCNPTKPTPKAFVEDSPKINYTVQCIRSIKTFCEKHQLEMPGQLIYSNAGVDYFPMIKEYLAKYVGFKDSEIDIIRGGMNADKKNKIKDRFNDGTIKVLLGSASIREGMNLQYRATDLYVLWLDWNSIDVKQLEGRIWRQGNRYSNVRVTFPLIENSIDIFRFQKHEEKTSRINEIWQRADHTNTLKLEELNPAELKKGLITDPYALAELTVIDQKEAMLDEINSLQAQLDTLKVIDQARTTFDKQIPRVKEVVNNYRPLAEGQSARQIETLFRIFKEYLKDPETETYYNDESTLDQARKANHKIQLGIKEVLTPRGLDITFDFDHESNAINEEIQRIQENLSIQTGDDAVEAIARQLIEERSKQKFKSATVEERVEEFAQLNEKVITEGNFDPKQDKEDKTKARLRLQQQERIRELELLELELQLAA